MVVSSYYMFVTMSESVMNPFFLTIIIGLLIHGMLAYMLRLEQESQIPFHGTTTLNLQEVRHSASQSEYILCSFRVTSIAI